MDLFNNVAILTSEHFISPYDDIELGVYSESPTTHLMICSDIRKSPSLTLECVNLAKKSYANDGNDEYSKYLACVGRGEVNVGFLGFVRMHVNGKNQHARSLRSFTI